MITVVVPTYNEEKNIEGCLTALTKQSIPRDAYEIIVVDGNSKDRTTEIAAKYADKVIQQVSHGVGGARNDGAMAAKGEIVATTDADCLPDEDWLEIILNDFKDERMVAVTGYLDPMIPKEMHILESGAYKCGFKIANGLRWAGSKVGYYHLCGANTAFRRDAFIRINGYSDLAYSDDVEIAKRLGPHGKMALNKRIQVDYSIRRIQKLGLAKYTWMIMKNDFNVIFLGKKPTKGNYAKQEYN
ncbi:TPA: glycosyltransferase [Candidatus Bathyarchaeota archaeon]|nr:glycosyltransferase [Candidatus Bathyarchaeota archaeon]